MRLGLYSRNSPAFQASQRQAATRTMRQAPSTRLQAAVFLDDQLKHVRLDRRGEHHAATASATPADTALDRRQSVADDHHELARTDGPPGFKRHSATRAVLNHRRPGDHGSFDPGGYTDDVDRESVV